MQAEYSPRPCRILSGMTPDPSTVQLVNDGLKHAESFPITIGFFILIGMFVGFFYWLLFRFYPFYRDEQEKNRLAREIEGEKTRNHLAGILAARDEKAAAAIADERSAGQQRGSMRTSRSARPSMTRGSKPRRDDMECPPGFPGGHLPPQEVARQPRRPRR